MITASQLQQELYSIQLDFSNLTVDKIEQYLAKLNAATKATFDAIASATDLSFATVVQPMINLEIANQVAASLVCMPMHILSDKELHDVSTEAVQELQKYSIAQEQREDVYAVFNKYMQTKYPFETAGLTLEEKRYVQKQVIKYKRNGLSLPSTESRKRITTIQQRLAELGTQFQNNINTVNTQFEYRKADLTGLPEDWFNAERLVRDDVYKVTLKYPDVLPILDYCKNREVRAHIFNAFNSRCATENPPLLLETLKLHQEMAQILGYANHIDYVSEIRMIKTQNNIATFIKDMNQKFEPLWRQNLRDLTKFARETEGDQQFNLCAHDMRYYMELREKQLCDVDHMQIKEYFNVDKVASGTMEIYQSLLGLRFEKYTNNTTWHPDVQFYRVYDADTNELMGDFALDLYPRDNKYSHAAIFELVRGSSLDKFTGQPNSRRGSSCVMVCNFPKDEGLEFDDVSTFFHEFGHVMHNICTRTQLLAYNGVNTETDFVEAPSQMLENWCYDARVLQKLSAHKTTGISIPQAMVQKIKAADKLHAGYKNKRQLMYATLDYAFYNLSMDQLTKVDLKQEERKVSDYILGLKYDEQVFIAASFGHIIGEYSAGYYSYMYSNVIALDMFATKFGHDPLDPIAGRAYRKYILEPGASKDGDQLVEDFLGRKPKLDAFLEHCGLQQQDSTATVSGSKAKKLKLA